jgi:hypothetical protein
MRIFSLITPTYLQGEIKGALAIVKELEEMSRDGKINAIGNHAVILIIHFN